MPSKHIKLETTCTMEIWSGFFGIDVEGNQPECGEVIQIEVEPDSLIIEDDGTAYPCYSIECPKCKGVLESGPYTTWDILSDA